MKNSLNFKNKNKKVLMLIDSHALLHRGYHAMAGFATRDGRPTGALFGFIKMIINARNLINPDYVVACFDLPKPTFRHIAYADYKGTRTRSDDDLRVQIEQSKDFCPALGMPICEMEGFEADDMLGTIAELYKDKYNIAIVSGDMDTLQLVDENVKVCTLKKGSEIAIFGEREVFEKYELTPLQVPDYKGLSGDPSDNIPGVSGVGPKTAIKILKEFKTVESLYDNIRNNEEEVLKIVKGKIYENIKSSEEEANFSKTLATIRRDAPIDKKIFYNFEKEEGFAHRGFHVDVAEYERLCNLYELHSLKKAFEKSPEGLSSQTLSDNIKNQIENEINSEGDNISQIKKSEKIQIEEAKLSDTELSELQVMSILLKSEYINLPFIKIKELHSIEGLADYNEVKKILLEKLEKSNMMYYFENFEKPLFEILNKMRSVGVLINREELVRQKESIKEKINKLEKHIYGLAGEEFLISSPKQLGVILYDKLELGKKIKKTASGQRSTNVEMLESMRDEHEIISFIMSWREMSKVYNTYIEPLETYIGDDGRVHPHFLQAGASTGRFSCENPNMQNLPRNSELGLMFRKVFVSDNGQDLKNPKTFISADYSQIDLRSAALLSQDEKLLDIFKNGTDIHRGVAAQVLGKELADVSDEERRKAKAINFGILYGMGVNALKDAMGVERSVAQEFFDNFKNTFSTLMTYLDKVKLEAAQKTYTSTMFGRRRDVPLLASKLPFMRAQGERIAINAPVQGTSADILKLGMINVYNTLKSDIESGHIKMLLQIHDELVFECDESNKEKYGEIIKSELEKVLEMYSDSKQEKGKLEIETNVPLVANVSFGKSLFEL